MRLNKFHDKVFSFQVKINKFQLSLIEVIIVPYPLFCFYCYLYTPILFLVMIKKTIYFTSFICLLFCGCKTSKETSSTEKNTEVEETEKLVPVKSNKSYPVK
jgi:hypothetical protein